MKEYEVCTNGRRVTLKASSIGVAMRRGFEMVRKQLPRGIKNIIVEVDEIEPDYL